MTDRERSPRAASALVLTLALGWAAFVGSLAVARHENLRTNAFDLGYIGQALWNTAHGEPFRLTVLEGAAFRPEGLDPSRIRQPHSYLAFHVEPIDLPLAGLYALWPDPRFLLWLQAVVVALGALPAAWLAHRVVGGWIAGLVFGLAWLLAPGLEGAALSDFHAVALGATWLMAGLWLLECGRPRWAGAFLMLAAASREDGALAVSSVGMVLLLRSRSRSGWASAKARAHLQREVSASPAAGSRSAPPRRPSPIARACPRVAAAVLLPAALWTLVCFVVIAPYFNGGGNLFWSRYAWLGATPRAAFAGVLRHPGVLLSWLTTPGVAAYLAIQLLSGGTFLLLAPLEALAAMPLLALNGLSSFDWMRSGGAHYSALLAPLLLWAGAHGLERALAVWGRMAAGQVGAAPPVLQGAALGIVLVSALGAHLWIGASPLRPGFAWPDPDPRAAAVLALLDAVPPDAPASASSAVYPHLANRHRLYWFPAVQDAEWLAIDAVGASHPLTAAEMRDAVADLLASGDWSVVVARDGLLVLRRGGPGEMPGYAFVAAVHAPANDPEAGRPADLPARVIGVLPEQFFGFVRAAPAAPPVASAPLRFGGALELVGAELRRWPQVGLFGDAAVLETTWRAAAPIGTDLTFALATTRRRDGALVGLQPDVAAGPLWYPTSRWRPGELVRMNMTLDRLAEVEALGIAVLDPAGTRLAVTGPPDAVLWEASTIARVAVVR